MGKNSPYSKSSSKRWEDNVMENKCVVFDLDGTLSKSNHRKHLAISKDWDAYHNEFRNDKPNTDVITRLKNFYYNTPYEIIILTGKPELYRETADIWLARHNIPYDKMIMREDGDYRRNYEFKEDFIAPNHQNIIIGFDDFQQVIDVYKKYDVPCIYIEEK